MFETPNFFGVYHFVNQTVVRYFWCLRCQNWWYFKHQFWCLKHQNLILKQKIEFWCLEHNHWWSKHPDWCLAFYKINPWRHGFGYLAKTKLEPFWTKKQKLKIFCWDIPMTIDLNLIASINQYFISFLTLLLLSQKLKLFCTSFLTIFWSIGISHSKYIV